MMEVESLKTDDGAASGSSPSDDPAKILIDKVNGDDDIGYTITMNESDDEGTNDAVSNEPAKKATDKPVSPVKMNGKSASDEDSQSSVSNDTKDHMPEKAAKEEDDKKEDDKKEDDDSENKTTDEKVHSNGNGESTQKKSETSVDVKQSDDKPEKSNDQENGSADTAEKTDKISEKDKDVAVTVEKQVSPRKKEKEGNIDVVEIEDSPMKKDDGKSCGSKEGPQTAKGKPNFPDILISVSKSPGTASTSSTTNLILNARTGASMPYLPSTATGTSMVPPVSSVQLLMSQGVPGVLYAPSSASLQASAAVSTPLYLPAVGSSVPAQGFARNDPLLLSQYASMLANQASRFAPPLSQGMRGGSNLPPVFANIPEQPTSSKGQIDMIRWEVENHINVKPKYVKPNPKAELGNLTRWLFDLGSDLVKEYVYHDLVRIQHRRKDEGSLSAKEKDDFAKLQVIDRELNHKVGHLKYKLNKPCKCGFKTELNSVLYHHSQHAHYERGGFLTCSLCKFSTRQPNAYRFHMEAEHGRAGKMENRPSFYECPLCPYETNYTNRLDQHKGRCLRQFREAFNLHPSCMTGPEVSLCLENVFYYVFTRQFMNTIIPKPPAAVSASTKIRDMSSRGAPTANSAQTRKVVGSASTTLASASKQIAPRLPVQYLQRETAMSKAQSQLKSALSRNFPVISSKINTVPVKNFKPYTPAAPQQPQVPKPPQLPNQPLVPNQPPGPNQPNSGFEVCEICGGYVKDRKALRIHFFYAHRIDMPFGVFERPQPPLYCATCFARFWTAQGLQKHIEVHKNDMVNTTQSNSGVAGKCISCGHRVPNILVHMRMVHNRELRHYLAALMCIFCGNKFQFKKDVEAHMGKMHGVIVKNTGAVGNKSQSKQTPQAKSNAGPPASSKQPQPASGKQLQPASSTASKSSSGGKMNRSSQCVLCNLSFSRNVDLTRHCMRVHHTCMKCGLVVVDKESLSRHTCLHSASGMRTCQICKESGFHPAYYIKHMRDKHLRKCSVILRRIDRAVVESIKRPITISDSEDDEPAHKSPDPKRQKVDRDSSKKNTTEEKKASDSDSKKMEEEKDASLREKKAENKEQKSEEKETVQLPDEGEKGDAEKKKGQSSEKDDGGKGAETQNREKQQTSETNAEDQSMEKEEASKDESDDKGSLTDTANNSVADNSGKLDNKEDDTETRDDDGKTERKPDKTETRDDDFKTKRKPDKTETRDDDGKTKRKPDKTETRDDDDKTKRKPDKTETRDDDDKTKRKPDKTETRDDDGKRKPDKTETRDDDGKTKRKPDKTETRDDDGKTQRKPDKTETRDDDGKTKRKPDKTETRDDDGKSKRKPDKTETRDDDGKSKRKPDKTETRDDDGKTKRKPDKTETRDDDGKTKRKPDKTETRDDDGKTKRKPDKTETRDDDGKTKRKPDKTETKDDDGKTKRKPDKARGSELEQDSGDKNSADTADGNVKRTLRSQRNDDGKEDKNKLQNSVADKNDEEETVEKPNSGSDCEGSSKKRKLDKSDCGEENPVQKRARRSGSKGGDTMDLD